MERVDPFDWHRIFFGNENDYLYLLEIGFRVGFIYIFTVVLMRYMGKRGNRSLSIFENVLIIALGSATGDAMFYPKVPLIYACLVIAIIVGLTRLLQYIQMLSKPINTFLDGKPIAVVRHGKIENTGLKESRIREEELFGLLRQNGIRNLGEVEFAFFERSGKLSVFSYEGQKESSDQDLIDAIQVSTDGN